MGSAHLRARLRCGCSNWDWKAIYLDHAGSVFYVCDTSNEEGLILSCAGCWSHCFVVGWCLDEWMSV